MRILYVFRSLAVMGGIERVMVEKMNLLASMYGYEIYVLTTDQNSHPVPYQLSEEIYLEDLDIQIHHQYRYRSFKRLLVLNRLLCLFYHRLSEKLQTIQPNVIVCTTANYIDINLLAIIKGNIPMVVESHSICCQTIRKKGIMGKFAELMYRRGLSKSQMIVALTENDASEWRKIHSCVKVIPNVVHLNKGILSSLDQKRVMWVGRFDYQKRPMEMIEIWRMVYPQFPEWSLYFYGEGVLRQQLESTARLLDMNIHICHSTDRIFDFYRASSILVSTSLFEPFGLVIPEAMSCGLPIVAYNCPYGPADIISDGKNGYLIDYDNIDNYVNKLSLLMRNLDLRIKMGKDGYVSSKRYEVNQIMPLWRALFEQLIQK